MPLVPQDLASLPTETDVSVADDEELQDLLAESDPGVFERVRDFVARSAGMRWLFSELYNSEEFTQRKRNYREIVKQRM